MTKIDLAEIIKNNTTLNKRKASEIVDCFFDLIKSTLEQGETVKLAKFGNFELKEKKARKGRNPQTGETIVLAERRVLTFKPSTVLKKAVNK